MSNAGTLNVSNMICVIFSRLAWFEAPGPPTFSVLALQPDIATSSVLHDGEWRGVFVNKNALGQMMLLSCLVRSILIVADWGEAAALCAWATSTFCTSCRGRPQPLPRR